jgi:hypothetical protein
MMRCQKILHVLSIAAWSVVGATSSAAAATFAETYIEPVFTDCLGVTPFAPVAHGTAICSMDDQDIDQDFNTGAAEDGDGDDIFASITAAATHTSTGGIVHVIVPGIYRENVSVADSVTIRGSATGDTILMGACSGGAPGTGIDLTVNGKTLALENLDIMGFGTGVNGINGNLQMSNCKVDKCGTGVACSGTSFTMDMVHCSITNSVTQGLWGESGFWNIADSYIANNDYGIEMLPTGSPNRVTVNNSHIMSNRTDGIYMGAGTAAVQLTVHGCEIAANAARGIKLVGRNNSTVQVMNSEIHSNGSDGVYIENDGGCVSLGTPPMFNVVADSRIVGNVGDGIEVKGSGTSCTFSAPSAVKVSVFQNTVALNGAFGLNPNGGGVVACTLGQNQISFNVSGAENGGPVCTAAGASSNSVP